MASVTTKLSFMLLYFLMTFVGGLMALLRLLWTIITHPLTAFKKTPRDVPPACLVDPTLGTHGYVTANGIKFHYVAAGDQSKPLMLFLHGFPEFWFSWRYQLREFSKDYRVVAVDLRGYGETERPGSVLDYTIDKLKQDIVELIPALGYSKCVLVAHDWGGVIAWRIATRHPELVEKFIVQNCPHPKVYAKYVSTNWKQTLRSWYVFMFQWPKLPELLLSVRDYDLLQNMFTSGPGAPKNKSAFPPDVMEAYVYTFSQPGAITAAINYYRCMFKQQERKDSSGQQQPPRKMELPVLVIWGDDDIALDKDMADQHSEVASNLTVKHIPNCSHWVQQDAHASVNQCMREFLHE